MLSFVRTLVSLGIVITGVLLIAEIIQSIKKSFVAFEFINLVEKVVRFSKKIVEPKVSEEDNKYSISDANEFFSEEEVQINGNLLVVNGLELDFDKDLIEQFTKIHEMLIYMIYCEWSHLFMKRKMLKKCENIDLLIDNLKWIMNS